MSNSTPTHKVCPCCCGLDAEEAEEEAELGQIEMTLSARRTLQGFRDAAQSCSVCAAILNVLVFFGVAHDARSDSRVILQLPVGPGNVQIAFWVDNVHTVAQLYASTQPSEPWCRVLPLPDICTSQLSLQGRNFINTCLQTCLQSHTLCRQLTTLNKSVPSRLIHVGHGGDPLLRLVDTAGRKTGSYAALSYSWGEAVTMKTTSANMSDMKQQIRLDTLQETIVDAIRLTQELGIQYLWVDALCILQDSKQDWETESAKMGSIYANAVITFASVSSRSAAVPFLRHENSKEAAEQQQQVFSQMVETETGPTVIKARLIEQSGIHWRWRSDSDQRAPKEPWAQRGWTLQEQVLSSRLLMISSTEMQWVCRQAETCECLSTLNRRRQFGGTPLAQLTDAGETFRFWHKLVETYSNRTLTHGHDKLPAISGIAEVLQQKTASRYIAGLWESNFDLDLLWHKAGSWDNAQGSDPQAPSFSWASVDGEVDYYCFRNGRQKYKSSTTVLHIDLKTRPQAPLGTVDGAMLTLCGPLAEARITKYSGSTWAMISIADHGLEFIPDTHLGYVAMHLATGPEPVACRRRDGQLGIEPMQPRGSDTDTVIEFSPGIRCWIVKLGEFEFPGGEDEQVGAELMVMGVPASQHGCLERLGLISDVTGEINSFFREMENSNFLLM